MDIIQIICSTIIFTSLIHPIRFVVSVTLSPWQLLLVQDHFNESLTSGEESAVSEEQDGDIAELEAQTQRLNLKEETDSDKPDHAVMYKRKRPSRLRKSSHHFPPHSPFHPAAHQLMGSPTYAPLLPTPHLFQPLPPRYLQQQHGMLPKSVLNWTKRSIRFLYCL